MFILKLIFITTLYLTVLCDLPEPDTSRWGPLKEDDIHLDFEEDDIPPVIPIPNNSNSKHGIYSKQSGGTGTRVQVKINLAIFIPVVLLILGGCILGICLCRRARNARNARTRSNSNQTSGASPSWSRL